MPKLLSEVSVLDRYVALGQTVDLGWLDVRAVDRDTLGPILFLLENSDLEVQRAASAALGNLAVNSRTSENLFGRKGY